MTDYILEIKDLRLNLSSTSQQILKGIDLKLGRGKLTGIVGESGSGKTMTALSIMGLLSKDFNTAKGEILFHKEKNSSISLLDEGVIKKIRGKEIAMIFQEPMSSLNPAMTCGAQIDEFLKAHLQDQKKERKKRTLLYLEKVRLPDPEKAYRSYPHQLSGGQLQRVMIAMALSVNPCLLIADEPTTALDVTVQKEILLLLKDLQNEFRLSIMFITHDLRILNEIADDIVVMKEGNVIEKGSRDQIFSNSKMPYTQGLIACQPSLDKRPARLLTIEDFEKGMTSSKLDKAPKKEENPELLLDIKNINLYYRSSDILGKNQGFHALKNLDLKVFQGETLGLVGESGCGKTSLGKTILGLIKAQSGDIIYKGKNLPKLKNREFRKFRKNIQVVFQDPYSSLNPRIKIKTIKFHTYVC